LARLAYAGRLSLLISVGATCIAAVIGAAVGIVAGFASERPPRVPWVTLAGLGTGLLAIALGSPLVAATLVGFGIWLGRARTAGPRVDVDGVLMRTVDALLAFPFLLLVMAVGAAFERTSAWTVFVVLGTTSWLGIARVLRAKTMQVRSREFVVAARALGQSTAGILIKHLLPNVAGTLLVLSTLQVAQMMIAESVLAYLGVGVSPPTPTWGRMLFEGQDEYLVAPWLALAPGAAIVLSVWGFNLLGEGLRDALDARGV
jgi:ABC-type dipeptide/oligopeptide/nickel transport system permease subunit